MGNSTEYQNIRFSAKVKQELLYDRVAHMNSNLSVNGVIIIQQKYFGKSSHQRQ